MLQGQKRLDLKIQDIQVRLFLKKYIKRTIIFILGMNALSLGIVLNTKSQLGVGSITTLPYVFSQMTSLSLGTAITLLYFVFVVVQTLLLRKLDYKICLQFPFSFLVGKLIDFYDFSLIISPQHIVMQIMTLVIATLLTALGVYLMLKGDIVLNPSDGIVQTISQVFHQPFGSLKIKFDLSTVLLSCLLSWVFIGAIKGVGFGTLFNAFCIGYCVSFYERVLKIQRVR